jgi:hypothetical protein
MVKPERLQKIGIRSYKNIIQKGLKGGSPKVKAKGVPKHPFVFDIDGHHPLHQQHFEYVRKFKLW